MDPRQSSALLQLLEEAGSGSILRSPPEFPGVGSQAWNSSGSPCDWLGVTCCSEATSALRSGNELVLLLCTGGNSSVVRLDLPNAGLEGQLPEVFTSLPDLQVLDVSSNPGDHDIVILPILPPLYPGRHPHAWVHHADQLCQTQA